MDEGMTIEPGYYWVKLADCRNAQWFPVKYSFGRWHVSPSPAYVGPKINPPDVPRAPIPAPTTEEMRAFIDQNKMPDGRDACDVWEMLGERVGDTELIFEICDAHEKSRDVTAHGKRLALMLHDTVCDMLDGDC